MRRRERVVEDDKERTRQVQNEVNRLSNISKNREKAVLHDNKTWNVGEKTAKSSLTVFNPQTSCYHMYTGCRGIILGFVRHATRMPRGAHTFVH